MYHRRETDSLSSEINGFTFYILNSAFYIYRVYNSFQLAKKYLRYYFTASNGKGHGMHSPFVFDFTRKVLIDKYRYVAYSTVESLRKDLLTNSGEIHVNDFGAGSATDKTDRRKIASIAKTAAKRKKFGQLLYRMVQYYEPLTI